ncbi:hypothetical protein AALP_AA1G069600 [Arabis alpina]|uniref:Glycine-rich protein n=1 Tax=Arabis alpina TaxID=50452 RepID=A0A087HLM7_ARAAL|nr:hypothetical protein AALP_AA1G069600 [Arabis alpina]
MGLRRASLVLYILFIFHLQHNFPTVNSRPSLSDATNHETLPLNDSKPEVVVFEGKARELAVVIKKGGGGGGGRGGGGGGGRGGGGGNSSRGGGGGEGGGGGGGGSGSGSNRVGRVVPIGTGGGVHGSSGSPNLLRGAVSAVGWLGLSVLTGLFLV